MHEVINTSLHSRKVLTVPTDWNDDISEIGTTCTSHNNKFSPLHVLRRKKYESPKNFEIVRPTTEDSHFFFVEEENELREFEPEYYWKNPHETMERRDPPEDSPDVGTVTKPKSIHPFFQLILSHRGIMDTPREPSTIVGMEGPTVKPGEERQSRKPNKALTRSGREELSTDPAVQMSLVLQKKRSTKKVIDMATSSKKVSPTTLSDLALANRQAFQQDKGVPTHSSQRHIHTMETKRTQNLRTIDESPSECDESKAKPTVSAAIVRRSTGRPVSEWFKPRKTIIPVVTGKTAESNNHSVTPEDGKQNRAAVDVPDNMDLQSQIEKKDDPFNQLCLDIWSSGTELLTTTSAVLDSIGAEAMRSLQHIVSATVVHEPTKAIADSQEPSPEEKAQVSTHSDTCDKLEHPCIIRNFQNEKKTIDTTMRSANHVFNLTYIAPENNGQPPFFIHSEKQHKDKAHRKRIGLPAAAKWTKHGDGQKFAI